jgi:NarL family two-component system sensor histidine kinase LiaS
VAGSQLGLRHEVLLLEEEQLSAVDDERKRMSRELHDTLSQGFAGIFLHLESARHFMAENPEKSLSHVDEASGLARRSLASARASIRNLRTFGPGLDLQRELNDLAARLSAGPMVNIDCRAASEHQVPEEIAWHLLRIAEEGVTNAIKHSGATKIEVRLHTTAAWARLTVRDNGGGFDPDAPRSAGYGLIGMRERMHQFRGILEIVSSPGDGTEINASVALPEAATS